MSPAGYGVREAIIELARIGGGLGARLSAVTVEDDDALSFEPLRLAPDAMPGLDTSANVTTYGDMIKDALVEHAAIRDELKQLFLTQAPDTAILRFLMGGGSGADLFRWEAVTSSSGVGFPAVSGACTVCRVADVASRAEPVAQAFDGQIAMAAFLSPAGVRARDEFDRMCAVVDRARAGGLDVSCTVFLGEQDLLDESAAKVVADKLPGIQVTSVPRDALAIEKVLRDRPVQILHFFCHGIVAAGEQLLELATINDWDLEAARGSALISVERLREILTLNRSTWITVLNSCSGGQAVERLHSMAFALAKGASPFALGMAEPLSPEDASLCTGALYDGLFEILRRELANLREGAMATLDLAPAVVPARMALHQAYLTKPAHAFGRWCLPILYQRKAPLRIMRVPGGVAARIAAVAGALRILPQDTPDATRDVILAILDKDPVVPPPLRPDRYGNPAHERNA